MEEKTISFKKYIEPIPETFEAVDFVGEKIEEPELITSKLFHKNKKIKKKAKIDNSIYDDILNSNAHIITETPINVDNKNIDNINLDDKNIDNKNINNKNVLHPIPRVTKVTPRVVIKKKKGH